MDKQLEDKLYNEFPDLFSGRHLSIQESLMPFGCECGNGWFDVLYNLCKKIKDSNQSKNFKFVQIKEKWGLLRIYSNDSNKETNKLIDEAEIDSENVCENCGTREKVTTKGGYVLTLCDTCRDSKK